MSAAEQQIAQEIIAALQLRIAQWQKEMAAIDVMRERQERKEQRYRVLAQYVAAAQAEIDKTAARIEPAQSEDPT